MKKLILSLSFIFILNSSFIQTSLALSCASSGDFVRAYEEYEAVILGKVIKVSEQELLNQSITITTLTIKVDQSFKTITEKTIEIQEQSTPRIDQVGETYLFFLKKDGEGYLNRACSPTTNDKELINQFLDEPTLSTPLKLDVKTPTLTTTLITIFSAISIGLAFYYLYRRKR